MKILGKLLKFFGKNIEEERVDKLVVGLGNFGKTYDNTRHNAGFEAVDFLAGKFEIGLNLKRFNSMVGIGQIAGVQCLLLKPLTFMNSSGIAVEAARKFYKLNEKDIVVLVDDVSFEPGRIRIRRGGSSGGHNGLKSIINEIGGEDFVRIKIGVGRKPRPDYDLASWVISKFDAVALENMERAYVNVASAIELILSGRIDSAMNKFN